MAQSTLEGDSTPVEAAAAAPPQPPHGKGDSPAAEDITSPPGSEAASGRSQHSRLHSLALSVSNDSASSEVGSADGSELIEESLEVSHFEQSTSLSDARTPLFAEASSSSHLQQSQPASNGNKIDAIGSLVPAAQLASPGFAGRVPLGEPAPAPAAKAHPGQPDAPQSSRPAHGSTSETKSIHATTLSSAAGSGGERQLAAPVVVQQRSSVSSAPAATIDTTGRNKSIQQTQIADAPQLPSSSKAATARAQLQAEVQTLSTATTGKQRTPEVSVIDYTPITTPDPLRMGCTLRSERMGRLIRMVIVMTVYTEEADLLHATMKAVAANLAHLEGTGWSWHDVLLVIMVDGIEKVSDSFLEAAADTYNMLRPELLEPGATASTTRPPVVHMFESTCAVDISADLVPKRAKRRHSRSHPTESIATQLVQVAFCLKARNGGKLNSHMWGMQGFARLLNPKYVMTIDVGTIPVPDNFAILVNEMEESPTTGGVAGEILPAGYDRCNGIAAAQEFEYWSTSYLDKATEAFFGYISVLPGALSLYRWAAIRGAPLDAYFQLEAMPVSDISPFAANLYLAEDRILAFNILARKDQKWFLDFVPSAIAYTDVPEQLPALVKQRRRWTNGSLFNLVYYLLHVKLHFTSAHNFIRKILFVLLATFNAAFAAISYLSVGLLFITFVIIYDSAFEYMPFAEGVSSFLFAALIASILISVFLISLVGDVQAQASTLRGISHLFSILSVVGLLFGLWLFVLGGISVLIISGVFGFFIAFIVVSLVWCNPQRLVTVFPFYFLKVPSFIAIFAIYSVANIHDSSWGTKEGQLSQETFRSLQSQAYKLQARADKLLEAMFSLLEFAASSQSDAHAPSPHSNKAGGITLDTALQSAAGLLAKALHQLTQAQKKQQEDLAKTVIRRAHVDVETAQSPLNSNKGGHSAGVQGGPLAHHNEKAMQTHRILDRISNLVDSDRMIIMESLNVYQAHQAAARRAELAAAKYAIDKKAVAKRFTAFRLMYIAIWLLCNAVIVGVVIGFSFQAEAALGIAGAILFTAGFRVIGSIAFRLQLCCTGCNRLCWRRLCRSCCFNEHKPTGRYACCCRKPGYVYHRELQWLREHGMEKDEHPFRYNHNEDLIGIALAGYLPEPAPKVVDSRSPSAAEEGKLVAAADGEQSVHTHEAPGTQQGAIRTGKSMPAKLGGSSGLAMLSIRTGHSAPVRPEPLSVTEGGAGDTLSGGSSAGFRGHWDVIHTHDGYASDNAYDSDQSAVTDTDTDDDAARSSTFREAPASLGSPFWGVQGGSNDSRFDDGDATPMNGAYPRRRSSGAAFMAAAGTQHRDHRELVRRGVMTPGRRTGTTAGSGRSTTVQVSRGNRSHPDVFLVRSAIDRRTSTSSVVRDHSRQSRAAEDKEMADLLFRAETGTVGVASQRMPVRSVSAELPPMPPRAIQTAPPTPAPESAPVPDTTDLSAYTSLTVDIPTGTQQSSGTVSANSGKPPAYPAATTPYGSGDSSSPIRPPTRTITVQAPDMPERSRTQSDAGMLSSRSRRGSKASPQMSPMASARSQRRVSWAGQSPVTPMSRVAASAFSFAAAIEEGEEEDTPQRDAMHSQREQSNSSTASIQSAYASSEAARARRTLMKNSAADFANPVTRKAYKIVHGRRMSTLRSIKRRTVVSGGVVPAQSTEPSGGAAAGAVSHMPPPARKWQPRDRPSQEQDE